MALRYQAVRYSAAVVVTCVLVTSARAAEYEIIDLGTLADRNTFALAVNEQGQVAGYSAIIGGQQVIVSEDPLTYAIEPFYFHAFAWTEDSPLVDLGVLGQDVPRDVFPKPDSRGFDINDHGQVVGRSNQPGEEFQGMLYLPDAALDLQAGLHHVPGFSTQQTQLHGVNDALQIVGESWGSGPRPILWERVDGTWVMTDLGDLGGPFGRANAINEHGQIVGQANVPSGDLRTFLSLPAPAYGLPAGMHDILPAFGTTNPNDINEHGEIVGDAGFGQAFIWLPEAAYGLPAGGSFLDPAIIPGAGGATATAINNHGIVVGQAIVGVSGLHRAMMWQDGQMVLLQDLLPEESGWWLISAQDINDAGEIVGWGLPPGEIDIAHAFLARPIAMPDPDLDADGDVDFNDLLSLLAAWGDCASEDECAADLDASGGVGFADLLILLANWS